MFEMEMEDIQMEMKRDADRHILVGHEILDLVEELLRISSPDTCKEASEDSLCILC